MGTSLPSAPLPVTAAASAAAAAAVSPAHIGFLVGHAKSCRSSSGMMVTTPAGDGRVARAIVAGADIDFGQRPVRMTICAAIAGAAHRFSTDPREPYRQLGIVLQP